MTGFESPNYTQTPNDLFDSMLPEMGYAELKVTLAVVRKTLGYHKESTRMTVTSIAAMTGLSRPSVLEGAEQAEKRGTLTRLNDGGVIEWTVNLLDTTVNLLDSECKATLPPSNKERTKKRSKENSSAKPRDPLLDHPAVVAFKDIVHITPNELQRKEIAERVGNNGRIDNWRETLKQYVLAGKNPKNIGYALDIFEGKTNSKPTGANHAATQKPDQHTIEVGARINAQRNGTSYEAELARLQAEYA